MHLLVLLLLLLLLDAPVPGSLAGASVLLARPACSSLMQLQLSDMIS